MMGCGKIQTLNSFFEIKKKKKVYSLWCLKTKDKHITYKNIYTLLKMLKNEKNGYEEEGEKMQRIMTFATNSRNGFVGMQGKKN